MLALNYRDQYHLSYVDLGNIVQYNLLLQRPKIQNMHQIEIPKEIIDRIRRRREQVKINDQLQPENTALLVIDMQNCFLQPDFSVIEVPESREIIPNVNRLANSFRKSGSSVIWTRHSSCKDWQSWYGKICDEKTCDLIIEETRPGSFGHALSDKMDVMDADILVDKERYSALIKGTNHPDLEVILRDNGIENLVIVGTLTNVCCESTARDAMMLGFNVIFVSDANATRSDAEHNATLISLIQIVADIQSTEEVLQLVATD